MTDDQLRDALHRLIARATCSTGLLVVGSDEWWAAPAAVQLGCVAALGVDHVLPAALKQASTGIASGLDWRAEAQMPSFVELQRRRAEPGPLAGIGFDAASAARWVELGHSRERAA